MKNLIFIIFALSFCGVILTQPVMIDPLLYSFSVAVQTPSSSLVNSHQNASIFGQEVDYFVYQYPLQPGSDATANAQVILQTSAPTLSRIFGRTSFSVDAAIYGYAISTYDGVNTTAVAQHPCGDFSVHLDNEAACLTPRLNSPGLSLDLSKKDLFAIEILSLDIGAGSNIIIRVWDNSGNTGCISYIHPTPVIPPANSNAATPYKPLVIFPFNRFTNGPSIVWSNIRAISIEFNSTIASVDLIIGPIQALGLTALKTSSTIQPVAPNSPVSFQISLDIDQYNTNLLAQLNNNITYQITIVDTLPAELTGLSPSSVSLTDQNNLALPVNTLSVNGQVLTLNFTVANVIDPKITYSLPTVTPYNFCRRNVCNNAQITVTTLALGTSITSTRQRNVCVDLKAEPVLTTTYQTCPTVYNDNVQTVARVCNNGNGLATSVNFVSTAGDFLSQCVPSFPGGSCNGGVCSRNLGDIQATQCVDVPISYDCSTFSTNCSSLSFSSSFRVEETCSNSTSTSLTCRFNKAASTPNIQITNTCPANISPSNQTTQLVSQVCNRGSGIARGVVFTHTSQGSLLNCVATIESGSCSGANCIRNLGNLEVDQCIGVTVNYNCPTFAQTCTPVSFPSTVTATEGCGTSVTPQTCSFNLNPGTPNVQIANTCPANISPSLQTTQLVSQVCNRGSGIARGVVFTHTSQGSLVNCTATIVSGSCSGVNCVRNLGDLAVNQCENVVVNYDCSSYATSCSPVTFPSSVTATETCGTSVTPQTCSFNLNPGTPNVQITNTCPTNISPSNQTTQLVSQVCNTGNGIARSIVFTHTSQGSLLNCVARISQGSCSGANCVRNLGDLSVGQCVPVTVDYDCSSFAQTCTQVTFPSTVTATEGCGTSVIPQTCSFSLNPGTPNVQITNNCPANISPSLQTTQLVSQVCNRGSGIARAVVFTHTSQGSLVNCVATVVSGSCSGVNCVRNLGDLAVNQCENVVLNYDCSSFASTCIPVSFPSSVTATETCQTIVTPQTCTFNLNPGTPLMVANSQICPSPLNQTNTIINYVPRVCNNGTGVARNVQFLHRATNSLVDCTPVFPSGTCLGTTCSRNLGNLPVNQCIEVPISYDCSIHATTCTPKTYSSDFEFRETCVNNTATQVHCPVVLNPGTPNVQISNTCPENISPSNQVTQLVSQVCNRGSGIARNVVFTHTSQGSLVNCSATIDSGSCNGVNCVRNLGDLAVNQCVPVTMNYVCTSFATSCNPVTFPSTVTATEGCGTSVTPQTCSFNLNPGTPNVQIVNTCPANISPSLQTTQLVSQVCNRGSGIARGVVFTHTSQGSLANCTATIVSGSCNGVNCVRNLGDLAVNQCENVTVNYDCSFYATSCSPLTFPSTVTATEGCGTSVIPQTCSFNLNPGIPKITTTYQNTCPTLDNNYQTSTVSHVCNTGNGIARNVLFNQTSQLSLSSCVASHSSGQVCDQGMCLSNLGDMAPGQCINVTINYNCQSFSTECIIKRFSAITNVLETCGTLDARETCIFRTTPSINVTVSELLVNTVPSRVNEEITWNIRVRNSGPQTAKSFILQKDYPQYTFPTAQTLLNWVCDVNRKCTYNGTTLTNGQTISNILFSVTLLNTIPIGTSEVCNSLVVMSRPDEPNCFSEASTQHCAPIITGVPDLVVKKRVFTSQYTFRVGYKNVGTGPVNNLVLIDNLQPGWTLSSSAQLDGWSCSNNICTQRISNVPNTVGQNSGESLFVVDVNPLFQTNSNGSLKCWSNSVNTTFDDVAFDPTPENNYATTGLIGSSCQSCCKQEPCPVQNCTLTCPPTNLVVNCPPVTCKCEVPEFWCPTCQTKPPSCDCNQCVTSNIQFA